MTSVPDAPPLERPVLAVIADDVTGAADVAGILARTGVATSLVLGPPEPGQRVPAAQAVVVGLRIRTAPVERAVDEAIGAARWLLSGSPSDRPPMLAWKICSTFDSTPAGNIGPVADALLDLTGIDLALVCPAYPANGRTVEGGTLLVHGTPLDRTPMRDHPLTPMRDADLGRLLAPQVRDPTRIDRLPPVVDPAVAIDAARRAGTRYLVADASTDEQAAALGEAVVGRGLPVIAAGLVTGIVERLRSDGRLPGPTARPAPQPADGPALVIAGSCSVATRTQLAAFGARHPVVRLALESKDPAADAVERARASLRDGASAVAVVASDDPEGVALAQAQLGRDAGGRIEGWLGSVARAMVRDGVRRVIIAGGETSGAVLAALEVRELAIGPEVAPGVPVLERRDQPGMLFVAKSGNFGGPDLFERALAATGTGVAD